MRLPSFRGRNAPVVGRGEVTRHPGRNDQDQCHLYGRATALVEGRAGCAMMCCMWILDPSSHDGYRRRVAVHEAGHAVMMCLLHAPPTYLELMMAGDHLGKMKPGPPTAGLPPIGRSLDDVGLFKPAMAVYLAGAAAVGVVDPTIYKNADGDGEEFAGEIGSDEDFCKARSWLGWRATGEDKGFPGAPSLNCLMQDVLHETAATLGHHRAAVLHIARALLDYPKLQGAQLGAVLEGAGLGDRAV